MFYETVRSVSHIVLQSRICENIEAGRSGVARPKELLVDPVRTGP